MRRKRDLADAKDREAAEVVARTLVPAVIKISAKSGTEGKLFGSVTTADIVAAVQEQTGVELDRRKLHLNDAIKTDRHARSSGAAARRREVPNHPRGRGHLTLLNG